MAEERLTWKQISAKWKAIKGETLSQEAILTCLFRSALSRIWKKGENQGNNPYLCTKDLNILDKEIHERAYITRAFDTMEVIDEATKLRVRLCFISHVMKWRLNNMINRLPLKILQ